MTRRRPAVAGSGDPAEFNRALLTWLGLSPDAPHDDVRATRERLLAFLDSAPPGLEPWARQQATAAEAAFALLSGGVELGGETERDARNDEPSADGEPDESDEEFDEDHFDEDDFEPHESAPARSGTRRDRTRGVGPGKPAGRRVARGNRRRPAIAASALRLRRSLVMPIVVMLAVAGVVYGVYQMGDNPKAPAPASANASPASQPLDEAKVAELMGKLKANPRDVDTLRALGDVYFQADDYKTAATWQQKIIDINPNDVDARLSLGVALFNSGDAAGAEKQWLKAVEIDPKQAEAHYDLGFLYLSKSPPDEAKAKAEWAKVIEIDPNSELAKTVSTHMDSLDSPSPAPSNRAASGK